MSEIIGGGLTFAFVVLSFITCNLLWSLVGWYVYPQAGMVLLIAALGENHVSGKGYYSYTSVNRYFVGRVPLWIPFMWVFVVQGALLMCLLSGFTGFVAVYVSGIMCILGDFLFAEPYLCAQKKLWEWKPVEKGYFKFVPAKINRFTAPLGNYVVWFVFPFLLNSALYITSFVI